MLKRGVHPSENVSAAERSERNRTRSLAPRAGRRRAIDRRSGTDRRQGPRLLQTMPIDHEAAIRAATDALAEAILAAVRAEAVTRVDEPEQLLSIDRAAALAGVGRTTIYAEIGAGRLRSIKVGRRRLVPVSAIAELAGPESAPALRPAR
jgi:excisionase family DNA binding protein